MSYAAGLKAGRATTHLPAIKPAASSMPRLDLVPIWSRCFGVSAEYLDLLVFSEQGRQDSKRSPGVCHLLPPDDSQRHALTQTPGKRGFFVLGVRHLLPGAATCCHLLTPRIWSRFGPRSERGPE